MIKIQNLDVYYPTHHALKNITLTLDPGQVYGLIGANGSGKSTLFKSIMGLIKPTNGSIRINNKGVDDAIKASVLAYVPQTETVDWHFPVSVYDVVMMGRYAYMGLMRTPRKADHAAVIQALETVDMLAYQDRQIDALSGGQKKRVFVARALAQNTQIMLLDEPFTGVDVTTEALLGQLFKTLANQGRLLIVSTHNLGSVPQFCQSVILLNQHIIAAGPVKTTFTPAYLRQAFGGNLRHHYIDATDIHHDKDDRGLTVLTDDEKALIFYGTDIT